jgi:hypothetical protein
MDYTDTKSVLANFSQEHRKNLKIVHLNAQSLTYDCHVNEFLHLFDGSQLDIIAVSETFYKTDADIVPLSDFNVFCSSRTTHDGGGVAVYVKSCYKCKILTKSTCPSFRQQRPNFIILEISCDNKKLLFACIYRPPKAGHLAEFEESLLPLCTEYENVIVAGDVNAHFGSTLPCDMNDSKSLMQLLEMCNLSRIPYNPTYHTATCDSSLDMIATNCLEKLVSFIQTPACGLSAHDILLAVFSFKSPKCAPTSYVRRDFSLFDVNKFRDDVLSAPWDNMLQLSNVNDKVDFFNHTLNALYDKHAPLRTYTVKHRRKPWFTSEIDALFKSRDIAYRRFHKEKSEENWAHYKTLRNKAKRTARDAKLRYAHSLFSHCKRPKDLWQNVKKLNIFSRPAHPCSYPSAEDLNSHYTSVPITDNDAIQRTIELYKGITPKANEKFNFKYVQFEDFLKAVSSLTSNAKGVDSITAAMIKHCIFEISPAVLHIFNYSLQHGVYPDLWKVASVTPIPKKSGACNVNEFRPISILCTLSKVLEKIVHAQLVDFLVYNDLFDPMQSGFRFGHSTNSALLKVIGDIRESMGSRKLSLLILYDFSNAFPSVHHELLLTKLQTLGLSLSSLSWFRSYLDSRQQFVKAGDTVSLPAKLTLGVPQGSVLGPLLYVLYVYDICSVFSESKYHLYADDLQDYIEFYPDEWKPAIDTANREACKLVEYAKCHNLKINSKKTQVIVIGNPKLLKKLPSNLPFVCVDGSPVQFSDTVVDLGVTVDRTLSWEPYAIQICNKSIAALHGIRRHKELLSPSLRKRLVESLIFPIFDYGSVACEGMSVEYVNRIQRLQNACVRFVLDLPRDCHITPYYRQLNWLKIKYRRDFLAVSLLKNVLSLKVPSYLYYKLSFVDTIHNRNIRNCKLLRVPQHRTDKQRGAFWIFAVVLWNNLPDRVIVCNSCKSFKFHARQYLISAQCNNS